MKRKNIITLVLIFSSMALLVLLQFFWLRSAYTNAEESFRKETNLLFRNTILSMHDTLIQRSIEPLANDSMFNKFQQRRYSSADSLSFLRHFSTDSALSFVNIEERGQSRVELYVSGNQQDSVTRILRPLVTKLKSHKTQKRFIIRLGADSLKLDSIRNKFQLMLHQSDIEIPFRILTAHNESETPEGANVITSDYVRISPANRYAVSFSSVDSLLIKEITPQILFSVFLTLLTLGAFYVMYKNMRSQQRLMELKNDFISNITHELKTPVATVSVALEALKNFKALNDVARTNEYLDIAQSELNRLTLMTDKILKTAVFENKGVDFKPEAFDMDELMQEILSSMKLVFEKRNTQLMYQKQGTHFMLEGGKTHLTNVVYNLLDNALKYSDDGAALIITLKDEHTAITFSIRDHGMGIPKIYQHKIFEKFFRVPSGDVHTVKGYGLGLSYVAAVVKRHAGKIAVESEPASGSNFIITLPKKYEG